MQRHYGSNRIFHVSPNAKALWRFYSLYWVIRIVTIYRQSVKEANNNNNSNNKNHTRHCMLRPKPGPKLETAVNVQNKHNFKLLKSKSLKHLLPNLSLDEHRILPPSRNSRNNG